jgi:hypothetical protein
MAGSERRRGTTPWGVRGLLRTAVLLLLLDVAVDIYLEVRLYQGGEKLIIPVFIIAVLAVVVAIALAATQTRAAAFAAAVLMLVALVGSASHSADNLLHGPTLEKHIFGGLEFLALIAALIANGMLALRWNRVRPRLS